MKRNLYITLLFLAFISCGNMVQESESQKFSEEEFSQEHETQQVFEDVIEEETTNIEPIKEDTVYINPLVAKKIKPVIQKWLTYYKMDASKFMVILAPTGISKLDSDTVTSLYYRAFEPEHDVYKPKLYDYSSNKNLYVTHLSSLGVYEENGKLYYYGGDDCQEIYLVDRKQKKQSLILWLGSGATVYDCRWIDNNTFVLLGFYYRSDSAAMWTFDLSKDEYAFYSYDSPQTKEQRKEDSYFEEYVVKPRGIICDENE